MAAAVRIPLRGKVALVRHSKSLCVTFQPESPPNTANLFSSFPQQSIECVFKLRGIWRRMDTESGDGESHAGKGVQGI